MHNGLNVRNFLRYIFFQSLCFPIIYPHFDKNTKTQITKWFKIQLQSGAA